MVPLFSKASKSPAFPPRAAGLSVCLFPVQIVRGVHLDPLISAFPDIPIDAQRENQKSYLDLRYGPAPMKHGEACKQIGIHRNLPLWWRNHDPIFAAEESLRRQAKHEADVEEAQEKHARRAELLGDFVEKGTQGMLIAAAGPDGKLTPQAMANLARDEDVARWLATAARVTDVSAKVERISRDLPANGPQPGTNVNVAATANAGASSQAAAMSASEAAATIAPLTPDEKADRLRAVLAARRTIAGGGGANGTNGNGNGTAGNGSGPNPEVKPS